MASPIQLHPRIRERPKARLSSSALAEFIIATPDKQDDVLHDARFVCPPAVWPHGDAIRAIQAHCHDFYRSDSILDQAQEALNARSKDASLKPSMREEAARCVETIELYRSAQNAFGIGKLQLFESPRFEPVKVHGVDISVQPHVLVGDTYPPLVTPFGAIFFRPQKAPNPDSCSKEETRTFRQNYRREMARYMLVIARMCFIASGRSEGDIDVKKLFVCDLRLGERIDFPGDRVARERRVMAACGQIARLWESVQPRPSDFDKGVA